MSELRPYQTQAIERLRESLRSGRRRPVLQLPTGAGKSLIAAEIVNLVRRKGKRIAFTVPRLALIDQTVEMFHAEGIREIGVVQSNHIMTDWSLPVQICSVQTLERRKEFPDVDGVIIDECHRASKVVMRWMYTPGWERKPFIGLSASPWAKGMGRLFDDLIVAATTQELIDAGYLSPFRVFAPAHPDLKGVKIVAGDYHEGQLSQAMNKAELVADVVDTWMRLSGHAPTICFAVDRAHAKSLQKQFEGAGIAAAYMDAYTPESERRQIKEDFHAGRVKVVTNVDVLTLGVDWDVRCLILARPTRSEIWHTQAIGRALRTAEAKEYALLLDHADNHARLGFVTDIYHDSLSEAQIRGETVERRGKLPKECPQCHYLRPVSVRSCPNCGFTPVAVPRVETREGHLEEIEPQKKGILKSVNGHVYLGGEPMDKGAFYGQLQFICAERGYRAGWAAAKFREAVGVWPNHYRHAEPAEPTPAVRAWVVSRQIAWSKSRNNPKNQDNP